MAYNVKIQVVCLKQIVRYAEQNMILEHHAPQKGSSGVKVKITWWSMLKSTESGWLQEYAYEHCGPHTSKVTDKVKVSGQTYRQTLNISPPLKSLTGGKMGAYKAMNTTDLIKHMVM